MSKELTDAEIDAALARMAWLLGPEFVAECEAGVVHFVDKRTRTEEEEEERGE